MLPVALSRYVLMIPRMFLADEVFFNLRIKFWKCCQCLTLSYGLGGKNDSLLITILDAKTEGSIKLNISNFVSLKQKVTTSFYMIANLPWLVIRLLGLCLFILFFRFTFISSAHECKNICCRRLAAKTECTKRTSNMKFFSVYIDCNPASESTLWSCDAIVEFRLISHKSNIPHFSRQVI